jgi:hypothetical protein
MSLNGVTLEGFCTGFTAFSSGILVAVDSLKTPRS